MSAQIAKSATSMQAGRRTSLSLQSSSGNKSKNTSTDSKKEANDVAVSKKPETTEKKCESPANVEKKAENTPEKISKAKPESSEKPSPKTASKSTENGQENGINNKESKSNGHKHDNETKNQNDKEDKKENRDGLRQKLVKDKEDVLEKKEEPKELKKEENKAKNEKSKETKNENKTTKVEEAMEKKQDEITLKPEKKLQEVKLSPAAKNIDEEEKGKVGEPETPKKSDKQNKTSKPNTPTIRESRRTGNRNEPQKIKVINDLTADIDDAEEMESLIVEPEITEEQPLKKTETGKILKLKQKAPITPHHETQKPKPLVEKMDFQTEISNTRSSTYTADKRGSKFLHTDPATTNSSHPASTSSGNDRAYLTSYRGISGRRSLRSASREFTYQSNYRESYRKINTELDNTSSSLNVTVGSEIPNDNSFSFLSRGRKRERTPPAQPVYSNIKTHEDQSGDDENDDTGSDIVLKSPKRARLDFSTIFGIVASPVTMLRSRLSRAKLQCSTPNGKTTEKDNESEEGVENVSEIEAEEAMENDNIIDEEEDVIIKESEDSQTKNKTKQTGEVLPPTGYVADYLKEKNSDVDNISDTDSVTGQPLMNQAKKRNCTIM